MQKGFEKSPNFRNHKTGKKKNKQASKIIIIIIISTVKN
jgi:hypothetical protein